MIDFFILRGTYPLISNFFNKRWISLIIFLIWKKVKMNVPGFGENKTFKDLILDFEKHASAIFWYFINQQLIGHGREESTDQPTVKIVINCSPSCQKSFPSLLFYQQKSEGNKDFLTTPSSGTVSCSVNWHSCSTNVCPRCSNATGWENHANNILITGHGENVLV